MLSPRSRSDSLISLGEKESGRSEAITTFLCVPSNWPAREITENGGGGGGDSKNKQK